MKRISKWLIAGCWLLIGLVFLSGRASAAVPHLIRYQGTASDVNGVPLEGPYTLTFRLYNAETAGAVIWQETQSNVSLTKGHFSVLLGQVTPLNADWSTPCWLSIQVGTEAELSPRQRITSVPLALRAEVAEQLATPQASASNIVTFSRTAAAGSGIQSVTGMGFQPTTVFMYCTDNATVRAAFGAIDDDGDGVTHFAYGGGTLAGWDQDPGNDRPITIDNGAGDSMVTGSATLTSDGFNITWTKNGSGYDVICWATGIR